MSIAPPFPDPFRTGPGYYYESPFKAPRTVSIPMSEDAYLTPEARDSLRNELQAVDWDNSVSGVVLPARQVLALLNRMEMLEEVLAQPQEREENA